ncbi:hypothetical protein TNCV_3174571 [Trichonephila clavipes]|nr:hypothetical protein TNCV_3174571 [Trichonephila clavipes]
MQPDLRMHICGAHHSCLQHQKDVNQKQYICVKHDFVVSNHTITVTFAFRYNPVEDSRFRQHIPIYTMMEVYPYCCAMFWEFKEKPKGRFLYH